MIDKNFEFALFQLEASALSLQKSCGILRDVANQATPPARANEERHGFVDNVSEVIAGQVLNKETPAHLFVTQDQYEKSLIYALRDVNADEVDDASQMWQLCLKDGTLSFDDMYRRVLNAFLAKRRAS